MNSTYGAFAVALVAVATIAVGAFGLRISRTTSDSPEQLELDRGSWQPEGT